MGEVNTQECKTTIRLLQQVQAELETKTKFLEGERLSFMERSRTNAEEKEAMRRK